jgi:hypothetical protein
MFNINRIQEVLFPHAYEDLNNLYNTLGMVNSKYNFKMIGLIIYCYKDNDLRFIISSLTKKGEFIISKPDREGHINSEREIIHILS